MTPPVRIAQLSCGPEYSGVQQEINEAAKAVNGEIFFPDIALKDVIRDFDAVRPRCPQPGPETRHCPGKSPR